MPAISPSPPRGPLVRVHCLEDSSPSQSIQNTSDTFLSPQFFLFVSETSPIHAADLFEFTNCDFFAFKSKNCSLLRVAMDPDDRQIALSENLENFQPYVFFFEFLPLRSWSSIWAGTNYQGGGFPAWTCLNIWVASYSLISISISLSPFISNSSDRPIGLWSSPPPQKFPSNSIKASTLVTIKPWSKPAQPSQMYEIVRESIERGPE